MPARSLPAHGRAVSEPRSVLTSVAGQEPGDRDRGGALLLGYFLLGKQEKVTRSQDASGKTQGCVFCENQQSKQDQNGSRLPPGWRGG